MSWVRIAVITVSVGIVVLGVASLLMALLFRAESGSQSDPLLGQRQSTSAEPSQTEMTSPESLAPVWIPVEAPTSLVIRRGSDVILASSTIDRKAVSEGETLSPNGTNLEWISNRGTGVGTDMGTAWIHGHNLQGTTSDPFGRLGMVQPGDIVEITTNGGTVSKTVRSVDTPLKVYFELTNDPATFKLVSCTDDGARNIIVTAT